MKMLLCTAIAAVSLAGPAVAQNSAEDARAAIRDYYAAIDRGDYRRAYGLWSEHGDRSGMPYGRFVRGFARTAHTSVTVGRPYDEGAGAGSIYITVPVMVNATLKNGTRQRFVGTYLLRHVNDIDGASAWQRRWHIGSASLRAVAR